MKQMAVDSVFVIIWAVFKLIECP